MNSTTTRRSLRARRGFAMLTVLWLLVASATVAAAVRLAAREAIGASRNRTLLLRTRWLAEGCLVFTTARLSREIGQLEEESARARYWGLLDQAVPAREGDCSMESVGGGAVVDANLADTALLARALAVAGASSPGTALAALLDWRDTDDVVREGGAERGEYLSAGALAPRNAPFATDEELQLVRGLAELPGLRAVLGAGDGLPCVNTATPLALLTLPGFTREAADRLLAERRAGRVVLDLDHFARTLADEPRDSLLIHLPELMNVAVLHPAIWHLRARARLYEGAPEVTVEGLLARDGNRIRIVQRRGT